MRLNIVCIMKIKNVDTKYKFLVLTVKDKRN